MSTPLKREGWKAALEYVAMNDEPTVLDAEALHGQPTVQLLGIVFGKSTEDVANAVVKFRRKYLECKLTEQDNEFITERPIDYKAADRIALETFLRGAK